MSNKTKEAVAGFQRGINGTGKNKKGEPKAKPSKGKIKFLKRSMHQTMRNGR